MNSFDLGCAVLSAAVYREGVDVENWIPIPDGAIRLSGDLGEVSDPTSGFEASAFLYQGRVVVVYAGTNTDQVPDLLTNGALALGLESTQLKLAAEFYLRIKQVYGPDVTFTGHSLGGGLAALMGVFFDQPAVTFDPAPFRLAATQATAETLRQYLYNPQAPSIFSPRGAFPVDAALSSFTNTEALLASVSQTLYQAVLASGGAAALLTYPTNVRGESGITAYAVRGEFLTAGIPLLGGILGLGAAQLNELRLKSGTEPEYIEITGANAQLGLDVGIKLHSMTLLALTAACPDLVTLLNDRPDVLELMYDANFYQSASTSSVTDFRVKLALGEFGDGLPGGYVAKFVADMNRAGGSAGMTGQSGVRTAMAAAAMEYYYFANPASAPPFFTVSGNGVHFNLGDIQGQWSDLLSPVRVAEAVRPFVDQDEWAEIGAPLQSQRIWHVQTGEAGLIWTAGGVADDAAVGGAQADIMDAGGGNDILIGGAGMDFLSGGEGSDTLLGGQASDSLYGGAGNDQLRGGLGNDRLFGGLDFDAYVFGGNFGFDTIADEDGKGSVTVHGVVLVGGKRKPGEAAYHDPATSSKYVRVGSTLLVTKDGSPTITIKDWSESKNLGITLIDEVDPPPPPAPFRPRDPLVLDLDGDGLELRAADGQILFDHNADGIRTGTGWALPDDALLAWDRNGNGAIDSGRELFGVDTLKTNGQFASDGFDALAELDSNADGVFDDADLQFGNVRVWRDLDQDGVSDAGELQTLTGAGIASISLASTPSGMVVNNNRIAAVSVVTRADGSATTAGSIDFAQNLLAREFTPQTIEGHVAITLQAEAMPSVRGSGMVRDLREAASLGTVQGEAFVALVQQFASATSRDAQMALLDPLIDAWGATSTQPLSIDTSTALAVTADGPTSETALQRWARLNPAAHQHVATLERFYGSTFLDRWVAAVPGGNAVLTPPEQMALLDQTWQSFRSGVYEALVVQTRLRPYLDSVELVVDEAGVHFDATALASLLDVRRAGSEREALIDLVELNRYAQPTLQAAGFDGINTLRVWVAALPSNSPIRVDLQVLGVGWGNANGGAGDDILLGDSGVNELSAGDGDDVMAGGAGNDRLHAGEGHDTVDAGAGDDTVYGVGGDDTLLGGGGSDVLNGDGGDDLLDGGVDSGDHLYGGSGNDTYVWSADRGNDFVHEGAGEGDTIELRGLNPEDVRVTRMADASVQISSVAGGQQLVVYAGFAEWDPASRVERFIFADGTEWDDAAIRAATSMTGGDGADIIYGHGDDSVLTGGGGDDRLYGNGGNDTLDGGTGYDLLEGGAGDDTYVWRSGSGNDTVSEVMSGTNGFDVLQLEGLIPGDIVVRRAGGLHDIVITNNSTGERLVVSRGFNESSPQAAIEQVRFADGTIWDSSTLHAKAIEATSGGDILVGHAGDDTLQGLGGADVLLGGKGNDTLDGGAGDDVLAGNSGSNTYLFGRGDGRDAIDGVDTGPDGAFDTIQFKPGVLPSDVEMRRVPYQNYAGDWALQVSIVGTDDKITVNRFFFNDNPENGYNPVRQIRFDDGTTWDLQTIVNRAALLGTSGNDTIYGTVDANTMAGAAGHDVLWGRSGDDSLDGESGNDTLHGEGGADVLSGGAGFDWLYGGAGDDTYRLARGGSQDIIVDESGVDTIRLAPGIVPADVTLLRNSSAAVNFPGRSVGAYVNDALVIVLANGDQAWVPGYFSSQSIESIQFDDGTTWLTADILSRIANAPGAADAETGTAGDDVFIVDHANDSISETSNSGVDAVHSSVSHTLNANVENLTLTGLANARGVGNDLANIIQGNEADNILDGRQGADQLIGGAGDDIYIVTSDQRSWMDPYAGTVQASSAEPASLPWDSILELPGEGIDTLVTSQFRVRLPDNVENLVLSGMEVYAMSYDYMRNWNNQLRGVKFDDAYRVYDGRLSDTRPRFVGNDLDNRIDVTNGAPGTLFSGYQWFFNGVLIDGGAGADTMIGGAETTYYRVDDANDVVIETGSGGGDTVISSQISVSLPMNVENIELVGSLGISATGNDGANELRASKNSAANVLTGLGGDDTYWVGLGDTVVEAEGGGTDRVIIDAAVGGAAIRISTGTVFWLSDYANVENIAANGYVNWNSETLAHMQPPTEGIRIIGTDGDNQVFGSFQNDILEGGAGNDYLRDQFYELYPSFPEPINDADTMLGGEGNDRIVSRWGYDILDGGAGDDILETTYNTGLFRFGLGYGHDVMTYASGSTIELTDDTDLSSVTFARQGDDLVLSLSNGADDLTLKRYFLGYGASIRPSDGRAISASAMSAAVARGTLLGPVTEGDDVVAAPSGGGTVSAMGGNDDVLGSAGDDQLFGGEGADTISGRGGNDLLDGGLGNDIMAGGSGDDVYEVNSYGDQVWESQGGGVDTIRATTDTWSLTSLNQEVENLELVGAGSIAGFGNDLNNVITGNSLNNTLVGGGGADTLIGKAGDDSYSVDNASDIVVELAGEGNDTITTSVTYTLAAHVENLTLSSDGEFTIDGFGNDLNNVMVGNASANRIDGGAGADSMSGGAGNDTYVVDNAGDVVTESSGAGTDTVEAAVSWTLGSNVERLTLTGIAAIDGVGNSSANILIGNDAANVLNGMGGADTMTGGAGNDTYVVDNASDVVNESAGGGIDTIQSSVTRTLGSEFENLTLTGSGAISGTGNALDNVLTGNSGNNTLTGHAGHDWLDGGNGTDTMVGGTGDDTYVVERTADIVTELSGEGVDTIRTSVTLSALANNVENLVLVGTSAINGVGNGLDNTLVGNAAANTLTGGAGNDTMLGGGGNDTYVVDAAGDVLTEYANEGTDLVQSVISWTLGDYIENLTLTGSSNVSGAGNGLDNVLTGNGGNNTLTGGAGHDTIDGGTGNDTMLGGTGNDTYTVNVSTDVVTEVAGEGIDTVRSSVAWTLGNHLENLTLTGSGAISGTGNTLDNVLTGNSANNTLTGLAGNDTLDGGTGTDTMIGGAGDDIYIVNVSGDVTTEAANEGTDTVRSAVTRTLGTNLENLTLTGGNAVNGTGNALANVLIGNTAVNVLTGAEGNDTYDGAGGNDTYSDTSTTSSDAYRWGIGSGLDTLTDAGGSMDYVDVFAGAAKADLRFAQSGNHLEVTISGQTDKLTINNWFASSANQVEEIRLSDGSKVLASEVAGLLGGGMSALAVVSTGETAGNERKFAHPVARAANLPLGRFGLQGEWLHKPAVLAAGRVIDDQPLHALVAAMAVFGARGVASDVVASAPHWERSAPQWGAPLA